MVPGFVPEQVLSHSLYQMINHRDSRTVALMVIQTQLSRRESLRCPASGCVSGLGDLSVLQANSISKTFNPAMSYEAYESEQNHLMKNTETRSHRLNSVQALADLPLCLH